MCDELQCKIETFGLTVFETGFSMVCQRIPEGCEFLSHGGFTKTKLRDRGLGMETSVRFTVDTCGWMATNPKHNKKKQTSARKKVFGQTNEVGRDYRCDGEA